MSEHSDKVYCFDCKFHSRYDSVCCSPFDVKVDIEDDWRRKGYSWYVGCRFDCKKYNERNACPYFIRDDWSFLFKKTRSFFRWLFLNYVDVFCVKFYAIDSLYIAMSREEIFNIAKIVSEEFGEGSEIPEFIYKKRISKKEYKNMPEWSCT